MEVGAQEEGKPPSPPPGLAELHFKHTIWGLRGHPETSLHRISTFWPPAPYHEDGWHKSLINTVNENRRLGKGKVAAVLPSQCLVLLSPSLFMSLQGRGGTGPLLCFILCSWQKEGTYPSPGLGTERSSCSRPLRRDSSTPCKSPGGLGGVGGTPGPGPPPASRRPGPHLGGGAGIARMTPKEPRLALQSISQCPPARLGQNGGEYEPRPWLSLVTHRRWEGSSTRGAAQEQ